jgi:2-polyprenyl-3-methyl-5-hydroxy-6-metoxy-1,4-benzoquinol methylase
VRRPRFRTDGLLTRPLVRARLGAALRAFPADARVLDVGCGLTDLAARLPAYVGCDRWREVLEECRRRHPHATFLEWDVLASDAPAAVRAAGPFDAVLMLALLEHLADPAAALRRAAPLLAGGGRIVVTTPHPAGRAPLEAGAALGLLSRHAAEEHDALLGRAELAGAGTAAGLVLASYRRFLLGLNQLAVFERPA